ncbi:hypothetical protein XA68_16937 [Ophiocordyceps unilateralis]|uniref:Aromatic prenyltransferase n=1 Tax=Ophiocordyceps unilateralis TaxID=268505 RepID=A0A2A9PL12_OPHUN|nr:hypothetical protein XA68_16937 [Ophiocordyceps unilateralis]
MAASPTYENGTPSQPWQALAQGLGYVNQDEQYWWSKVGPLAQRLMEWARYSTPERYRVLAFIYTYIVPACGPKPDDNGQVFWKTYINYDCTPIQLSLNFHDKKVTFRTANISSSDISGTAKDPINQQAAVDAMIKQKRVLPSQNMRWFNHFMSKLFLEPEAAAALKAKADEFQIRNGVQCMLSHDFPNSQVQCKAFFAPNWKAFATGIEMKDVIWDAIMALGDDILPYKSGLAILDRFTTSASAAAAGAVPVCFAFDSVLEGDYKNSRIKIYYATLRTAFDVMVEIYTLGGLLTGPEMEKGVQALRMLWNAVVNIPDGWPDDTDLPANPHRFAAVLFNFEIRHGAELPVPQIYIPAHYYGRSDLEIADGVDRFFQSQGLDADYPPYKENYIKCL